MLRKIVVGTCILLFGCSAAAHGAILLDRVMAIVNKEVITLSDVYKTMEFESADTIRGMKGKDRSRYFKENEMPFLENLIDMRLQLQEAEKEGIITRDQDVEKAIKNIKSKYAMTDEAFRDALKKDGSSLEEYKKRLSEQITVGRVVDQEVRSKLLVTDAEVDKYIAEHKDVEKDHDGFVISHIFLKVSDDRAKVEEKARDLYGKMKAGESFQELARKFSEDASAKAGGELGFVRRTDMSPDFLKAVASLKEGEVSEPFWSADGMHILKVDEIRTFKNRQELKEAVRQQLLDEKFNKEYKNWIKTLRERSYIEIKT
ncbi:MAG TPA: peptidylprolyl isomerase [Dissulfurispiraceae bacterium]